jgi:hypothetical protein
MAAEELLMALQLPSNRRTITLGIAVVIAPCVHRRVTYTLCLDSNPE